MARTVIRRSWRPRRAGPVGGLWRASTEPRSPPRAVPSRSPRDPGKGARSGRARQRRTCGPPRWRSVSGWLPGRGSGTWRRPARVFGPPTSNVPPLHVGDAALGDEPPDVALAHGEMLGHAGDVEKPGQAATAQVVRVGHGYLLSRPDLCASWRPLPTRDGRISCLEAPSGARKLLTYQLGAPEAKRDRVSSPAAKNSAADRPHRLGSAGSDAFVRESPPRRTIGAGDGHSRR